MKVVIIGAGISGLIAEGAFRGHDVTVYDPSPNFDQHKAVMRVRGRDIQRYVRCFLKEIQVQKAICFDGKIYNEPNTLLNNKYSLKIYDGLGDRSLGELGTVSRYLITGYDSGIRDNHIAKRVEDIQKGYVGVDSGGEGYDICISTIPMPDIVRMTGISPSKSGISWSCKPVHIARSKLWIDSTVHQTLYFPGGVDSPYRATIQEQDFIVESMEEITGGDLNRCAKAFGLSFTDLGDTLMHVQKIGKIIPIDDTLRRKIMMELTNKFNIYSFGRFATWKPLRVDQTLKDIEKIKILIDVGNENYYKDT